jgi:hypothetical protein
LTELANWWDGWKYLPAHADVPQETPTVAWVASTTAFRSPSESAPADHPLEPITSYDTGCGLTKIFIDNLDLLPSILPQAIVH